MSELDSVVNINVTANTVVATQAGFGTSLILTYHSVFPEEYRVYSDTAGMIADGFTTKHIALQKATIMESQDLSPDGFIVGRLPAAPTFTYKVTPTSATAGLHIKCKVYDPTTGIVTQIDRTIPSSSSLGAEATAVGALIDAISGVTGTVATNDIAVGSTSGLNPVVFDVLNCTVWETTADAAYDTELAALQLANDDWYFVMTDSDSDANVQKVSIWTEGQKKLYFWKTDDTREIGGTSVSAAAIKAAARKRTAGLWTFNPSEQGDAGWIGDGSPQAPGTITWALKTINGLTVKQLTTTQKTNCETNNLNHYMTIAGTNRTRPGKVGSGEYIDVIHGLDALEADMQSSVFTVLIQNGKVSYTGGGLDLIYSAVLNSLKRFEGNNALLVPGSSVVIMPNLADISDADKAARVLSNVKFTAKLAGAIQSVRINGTVSL